MDRGAWCGCKESDTTERLTDFLCEWDKQELREFNDTITALYEVQMGALQVEMKECYTITWNHIKCKIFW